MERWLGKYQGVFFAILRVMSGLMFMMHGCQKTLGWPGDQPRAALASLSGASGLIELVCGAMITIGFFTGTAAFLASGLMAVAYFMVHAKRGFLPIVNEGELAVLYCFVFLFMSAHGSGPYSVDAARGVRRR